MSANRKAKHTMGRFPPPYQACGVSIVTPMGARLWDADDEAHAKKIAETLSEQSAERDALRAQVATLTEALQAIVDGRGDWQTHGRIEKGIDKARAALKVPT